MLYAIHYILYTIYVIPQTCILYGIDYTLYTVQYRL